MISIKIDNKEYQVPEGITVIQACEIAKIEIFGKIAGVTLFTFVAVKSKISELPIGSNFRHILGISALSGIGFTVSMFITSLAYDNVLLQDESKIGILVASVLAAIVGVFFLRSVKVVDQEVSFLEENEEVDQSN